MRIAAALFFTACAGLAWASPTEVTAQYEVRVLGAVGARVQETYVRKGDSYTIESKSTSEGLVKMLRDETIFFSSAGKVGSAGLQPMVFERHQLNDRSRDVRATFDWKNGVMRSEYRGEANDVKLPGGTQDRLSLMYQFMAQGSQSAPKTVDVDMADGRKIQRYSYRLVDEPRLKTPAGDFDTLHYERIVEPGHSRTEFWLARDRHFMPVRVVYEDSKGIKFDQTLVQLQAR